MNKAFVREPDAGAEHCPRCGAIGEPVGSTTLDEFIRPESRAELGESASFCPTETCPIAYFDAFERQVTVDQLVRPVYPKDPQAPLCSCFGVTCDLIDADLAEGVATRTRNLLERAKSPEAHCALASPNARSCVAYVQHYFIMRRGR